MYNPFAVALTAEEERINDIIANAIKSRNLSFLHYTYEYVSRHGTHNNAYYVGELRGLILAMESGYDTHYWH